MKPVPPSSNRSVVGNRLGLSLRIIVASVLLGLLGSPVLAQVSCQVPYNHIPMPTNFSGTACSLVCLATTSTGYINHIQFVINGTVTKEQFFTQPQIVQPVINFDSTHFADNTMITITLNAWDTQGHFGTKSNSAPAYNKAYVIGNDVPAHGGIGTLSFGNSAVTGAYQAVNHADLIAGLWLTRLKPDILGSLPQATLLYAWTHGTPGTFGDCATTNGNGQFITSQEVGNALAAAGTGKSANHYPEYNFVFLDACSCGANDSLSRAFGTSVAVGPPAPRAFLGWPADMADIQQDVDWTSRLFQRLAAGDTLHDAINWANTHGLGRALDWNGNPIDPAIFGDQFMKLHGVYQGVGLAWYR